MNQSASLGSEWCQSFEPPFCSCNRATLHKRLHSLHVLFWIVRKFHVCANCAVTYRRLPVCTVACSVQAQASNNDLRLNRFPVSASGLSDPAFLGKGRKGVLHRALAYVTSKR